MNRRERIVYRLACWWLDSPRVRRLGAWVEHHEPPTRTLTGNCPIREHTGDGAYVGRCDFAVYDGVCPRHGTVADYPNRDDREVAVSARRFASSPDRDFTAHPPASVNGPRVPAPGGARAQLQDDGGLAGTGASE